VRELENLLHRALALSGGALISRDELGLPEELLHEAEPDITLPGPDEPVAAADALASARAAAPQTPPPPPLPSDLAAYLDAVERDILVRALERHRYNRTAAGASLGLSLRQMRYRMARLGVGADEGETGP